MGLLMNVKGFASRPAAEIKGGFAIYFSFCRRPTLDVHKESHRLAVKEVNASSQRRCHRGHSRAAAAACFLNKMRLSKTAIHDKQSSTNRSVPHQRCAKLILDATSRFIDGLFNDNEDHYFEQ